MKIMETFGIIQYPKSGIFYHINTKFLFTKTGNLLKKT